jgi:hypothetical protein
MMETPMTVRDLIGQLQTYPPDAVVLYEKYSDEAPLTADDIQFWPPEGNVIPQYGGSVTSRLICRHGHYMIAEESWMEPTDVHPPFAAVVFPGN